MTGDVGGRGGVTGGAGRGTGRGSIGVSGGGVGGKRRGTRFARGELATHPGTPRFDGIPRPVVLRVLLLEAREDVLGTLSSPEHQRPVVPLVEPHSFSFPASAAFG